MLLFKIFDSRDTVYSLTMVNHQCLVKIKGKKGKEHEKLFNLATFYQVVSDFRWFVVFFFFFLLAWWTVFIVKSHKAKFIYIIWATQFFSFTYLFTRWNNCFWYILTISSYVFYYALSLSLLCTHTHTHTHTHTLEWKGSNLLCGCIFLDCILLRGIQRAWQCSPPSLITKWPTN